MKKNKAAVIVCSLLGSLLGSVAAHFVPAPVVIAVATIAVAGTIVIKGAKDDAKE